MQVRSASYYYLFLCMLFLSCKQEPPPASSPEFLYVGTFNVRGSEGIYVYSFDRSTRQFQSLQQVDGPISPSFLALHPNGKFLYSANRGSISKDSLEGSAVAYQIDQASGKLQLINQTASYGESPCHVGVDHTGAWLYLSHYAGGSLSVFPVRADGGIGELTDSISYQGHGPNTDRQEAAHLHSIQSIPDTNLILAADLGTDKLYLYHYGKEGLTAATPPYLETAPGAGPRHFQFAAAHKLVYVAEELSNTVSVFQLDGTMRQRLPTLPTEFKDKNTVADIHLSPDGRFLYVSNRGHNSLAIYSIDSQSGLLTFVDHVSSGGQVPRNFLIDPQGAFVLVANQDSDNIMLFDRDQESGLLTPSDVRIDVPSPVSLQWK